MEKRNRLRGLVIKKEWLDKILAGEKTWEIRGSDCKKRGPVALIESGSGKIKGFAVIRDSFPVNREDLASNPDKHRISGERLDVADGYRRLHAWELSWAKRVNPIEYRHKRGAVIWVDLSDNPEALSAAREYAKSINFDT